MKRSDIELMAPVGSYEALAAAIEAGADSVYFGVGKLNMRSASAANFTLDDLQKIVETAHAAGVKAYLTVNTIVYEEEIALMRRSSEINDQAMAQFKTLIHEGVTEKEAASLAKYEIVLEFTRSLPMPLRYQFVPSSLDSSA